jgi:hypothetical protein
VLAREGDRECSPPACARGLGLDPAHARAARSGCRSPATRSRVIAPTGCVRRRRRGRGWSRRRRRQLRRASSSAMPSPASPASPPPWWP